MLKEILKKSIIYKKVYKPYRLSKIAELKRIKHELLEKEGKNLLENFTQCCMKHNIPYWLEFGTLLGAYRDKNFIKNDMDIDVGVYLSDARTLYDVLTNNGFKLVREFHVVGENGLEQTYEYHGVTIDVMYFYKYEDMLWCNGVYQLGHKNKLIKLQVTSHFFQPFGISEMEFLNLKVSVPDNTEAHLKEIFGDGFMVYDPNFPGDFNKLVYPITEKYATGFHIY